jgi:hypothetical protein
MLGDHGAAQIAHCLSVSAGSGTGLSRPRQSGLALTLKSLWLEQNEIHDYGAATLSAAVAGAFLSSIVYGREWQVGCVCL